MPSIKVKSFLIRKSALSSQKLFYSITNVNSTITLVGNKSDSIPIIIDLIPLSFLTNVSETSDHSFILTFLDSKTIEFRTVTMDQRREWVSTMREIISSQTDQTPPRVIDSPTLPIPYASSLVRKSTDVIRLSPQPKKKRLAMPIFFKAGQRKESSNLFSNLLKKKSVSETELPESDSVNGDMHSGNLLNFLEPSSFQEKDLDISISDKARENEKTNEFDNLIIDDPIVVKFESKKTDENENEKTCMIIDQNIYPENKVTISKIVDSTVEPVNCASLPPHFPIEIEDNQNRSISRSKKSFSIFSWFTNSKLKLPKSKFPSFSVFKPLPSKRKSKVEPIFLANVEPNLC